MSSPQRLDTSPAGLVGRATGELRQGAYREATATALVAIAAAQAAQMPQPMTVTVQACPQCGVVGPPTVEFPPVIAPPPVDTSTGLIPRVLVDEDGRLDDFFATGVDSVHFEALDDRNWYLSVVLADGQVWQLNFGAENGRGKGYARAELVS